MHGYLAQGFVQGSIVWESGKRTAFMGTLVNAYFDICSLGE